MLPIDDDTKSLLNKQPSSTTKSKSKIKKKKKKTFCQWLLSNPLSKLPFIYFIIGLCSVPALAIFHFMDPDTSYIICGGYIALNIFGFKHFYTLLGLKKQVDEFGNLNQKFANEHGKISKEVDRISKMNGQLRNTHTRIQAANVKNRENLNQFAQLQNTIKELDIKNVEELTKIVNKSKGIGDSWQNQLIEHERDMLHTVFDRYESASGKSGMTKTEFEEFGQELPDSYRKRFARLGTFDKLSSDGKYIKFSDFDAALDLFAEMDALDCDIDFSIEKTSVSGTNLIDMNELIPQSTLEVIPSQEDWGDISEMKRWKTRRKRYDTVKRKIVVHSKHYTSAASKAFTSSLGFDIVCKEQGDEKENDSDSDSDEFDTQGDFFANSPSLKSDSAVGRKHNTEDLINAGKRESQRGILKDK